MSSFDPLVPEFWIMVGMAVLCGSILGIERQARDKATGIRTSILICLGTAIFIRLGSGISGGTLDPTRVLGQLITGIGFLGAGVMFRRDGVVSGVTTAAVIWVLAAVGSAIGLGHYLGALALSAVMVAVLVGIELIDAGFRRIRENGKKKGEPA